MLVGIVRKKKVYLLAVVVADFVERSHLTPEIRVANPNISKVLLSNFTLK